MIEAGVHLDIYNIYEYDSPKHWNGTLVVDLPFQILVVIEFIDYPYHSVLQKCAPR